MIHDNMYKQELIREIINIIKKDYLSDYKFNTFDYNIFTKKINGVCYKLFIYVSNDEFKNIVISKCGGTFSKRIKNGKYYNYNIWCDLTILFGRYLDLYYNIKKLEKVLISIL